jgi:hypothetical protein
MSLTGNVKEDNNELRLLTGVKVIEIKMYRILSRNDDNI